MEDIKLFVTFFVFICEVVFIVGQHLQVMCWLAFTSDASA